MDIVINLHEGMGLDAIRPQVKLQTIRYTARAVFPMLVQIAMVIKANHLKSLLEDILHDVKRTDKMKLQNISVISLIAVYLTYVISMAYRLNLFLSGFEEEKAKKAIRDILGISSLEWYHNVFFVYLELVHRPLFEQLWIQVSVVLYSMYMLALYYAEMSLTVDVHKMADSGYLRALAGQKLDLVRLNARLNGHLSWMPLLWYAMIFLQSCGLILHLEKGVTDVNNVRRLIQFACEIVFAFGGLALAIKVTSILRAHARANVAKVILAEADTCGQLCGHMKLIYILKQHGHFDGLLFTLDRPLVLGFAGALVTFTIMFIQLK
ncbi:hypothetical protein HDE_05268 [Halotydeus destructor]|nr:hypothetical protein HDE_05268 [Halotydeus destructor]